MQMLFTVSKFDTLLVIDSEEGSQVMMAPRIPFIFEVLYVPFSDIREVSSVCDFSAVC